MFKPELALNVLIVISICTFFGLLIWTFTVVSKPIPANEISAVETHIINGDKLNGVVTAIYDIRRVRNRMEFTQESITNLINDASKLCQTWDYSRAKLFADNRSRPGSRNCLRDGRKDCNIYQYTVNLQCVN